MACINADGTLTSSSKAVLTLLQGKALTPEEIAAEVGQPLFKVRSSLRDMHGAKMIEEADGRYTITELGLKLLAKSS
ncbi:hypothetical protein CathTA2_2156 [Caldalkalibacillus thermarum TA2.A1]|uniref:Uncharacterized protein n=1 Tax=Caldalkalibacillus thermarum (strain TA2.A1) TaxID=986075 RepID=F5L8K1_CALTT|nr:hypothetical protein [Caldalkalibacillus thermarum]EGL82340.1 hypothetical protein CathTA2_2156 [Caldalkalibacillus thermarum TA2.A1]QZT32902.1 hypothetical protein HUR95_11180 [Caldalkalibacillus thermarum TA2.A1]